MKMDRLERNELEIKNIVSWSLPVKMVPVVIVCILGSG